MNQSINQYISTDKQVKLNLPEGKNFLVWLSHDVDRVYKTFFHSLYYALKEGKMDHLKSISERKNPYWNFEKIMKIEDSYGVKSTFFFLNETMTANIFSPKSFVLAKGRYNIDDPEIMKAIKVLELGGWEIGLHGSYLSYEDKSLLYNEKNKLESIAKYTIESIRQHYLNLSIPKTWEIQKSIGLKYDNSFGYTNQIGYKNDLHFPFRPFNDDFIVFPVTIMDKILFQDNQNLEKIWSQCLKMIDTATEKKGFLSLLWHQRVFNEADFPHYATIYKRLIAECQKRNAQFCTGKDVNQYIK